MESFGEYLSLLEQNDLGINVTAFVGHGTIHNTVMGDDLRLPDDGEIKEMVKLTIYLFVQVKRDPTVISTMLLLLQMRNGK